MNTYKVSVTLEGTSDIIFHAWNCDVVEQKSKSPKNSARRKSDNPEDLVVRDSHGVLCIPAEYLRSSIANAGRSIPDPRSARKSGYDLVRAAIIVSPPLAQISAGGRAKTTWDYIHKARVRVNAGGAITRQRPAIQKGWTASFQIDCLAGDYIAPDVLRSLIEYAGTHVGLGDFRPIYGRFRIVNFEVSKR